MRSSHSLLAVATVLLSRPRDQHWGYDIGKVAGVRSGVLYPILHRLLNEGWVSDGWEDDPQAKGRPPRRYYTITDVGLRELGAMTARAQLNSADSRPGWTRVKEAYGD